jgi:hypothetical protein
MEPLSIVASVTGILTAAAKVTGALGQIKDAPASISALLTEMGHIKIVFTALQSLLGRTVQIFGARAALIQLDDIVVILTQTVLVVSELQLIIGSISCDGMLSSWQRLNWPRREGSVLRLVNQL